MRQRGMKQLWLAAMSIAIVGIGLGLATVPACSDESSSTNGSVTTIPSPADAVSEELMLALHNAKNLHHIADVHVADGKLDLAAAAVQRVLAVTFPADAEEGESVRLDARARLAKLLVLQSKHADAMKILDEGISRSKRESFFLANVYTVKGEVFKAMAKDARDPSKGNDEARAKELNRDAIKAYTRAISIDEALQKKLMKRRQR